MIMSCPAPKTDLEEKSALGIAEGTEAEVVDSADAPEDNPADDVPQDDPPADEPAVAEPTSPAAFSDRQAAHLAEIKAARQAQRLARGDWDAAKEDVKEKKAIYEKASLVVGKLIDAGPSLLDGVRCVESPGGAAQDSQIDVNDPAVPVDPDSWRATPLDKLDLTDNRIERLGEAGIFNLGDLADWTNSGNELTDVKGVGAKAAEKIEKALDDFWAAHPEFTR